MNEGKCTRVHAGGQDVFDTGNNSVCVHKRDCK